jgi:predicted ArsR family transcriptional regulator
MTKKPTQSKVESVIALCERKGGCTLADISTKLGVSKVAAASLIAVARAKGTKVKFDVEGGRYYV